MLVASTVAKMVAQRVVRWVDSSVVEKVELMAAQMAASRAEMMVVLKKNRRKEKIKLKPLK